VTEAEVVARGKPRVIEYCKATGRTEAEAWKRWGCVEKYGEWDEGIDNWEKLFLEMNWLNGIQDFEEDETDCFMIDSGIASAGTIPGLERELGLPHIENPDVKAVSQINFDRGGASIKKKAENEAEFIATTEA